jgi:iron complex outermembrane receptor protein
MRAAFTESGSLDVLFAEEACPMKNVSNRTRQLLLGGVAMTAALSAQPLLAQNAAATAPAASASPQASSTVEEVTVTARKRSERLVDVPVSANAISGAALQRNAISDMSTISTIVPQLSIDRAPSGNGAIITIRGIGSAAVDGSIEQEVSVNIDGVPTSRGRVLYQAAFDESSVDVLKGPQALYFGKNSPAGVISINSTNPGSQYEGYVRTGVEAETETWYGEAAVTLPITDVLSARIAFRGSDMVNGYITDRGGPITNAAQLPAVLAAQGITLPGSPYKNFPAETEEIGRLTLAYKPTPKFDATFKFLLGNHEDRGASGTIINYSCGGAGGTKPTSQDLGSLIVNGTAPYLTDPYGSCGKTTVNSSGTVPVAIADHYPGSHGGIPYSETVTILTGLTMNYHLTDQLLLTSVTGLYKTRDTGFANFDQTDFAMADGENNEFNTSWTQEVRLTSSFDEPLNFTGGLFYEHDSRKFLQSGFIAYLPNDPTTGQSNTFGSTQFFSGDTYSGYGELNWKILPKLELAGGARYTLEEKSGDTGSTYLNAYLPIGSPVGKRIIGNITEHNVSPQVTLSYHLTHDVLIYGAYKEGFKSGGFSEPAVIPVDATAQNQEFGQEHVHGEELGLKFANLAGGAVTGDVTLYNYVYSGLQLTAFDAQTISYFTQNAASALSRGVEVNLAYHVTPALTFHTGVGYSDAHYEQFPNSQCWVGQTVAEGCVGGVQSLSDQRLSRAPLWSVLAGVAYDTALTNNWRAGVTVDGRSSSGYFIGTNNNPYGWQNGYQTLDASVRLYDEKWEFSLVGRNLTDTIYATFGSDKPLGGRGDVEAGIGRPREVVLQATRRF